MIYMCATGPHAPRPRARALAARRPFPSKEKQKEGEEGEKAQSERASERRRPRGCEGGREEAEEGWMMLYCFELVMLRQRARVMGCASAACFQSDTQREEKTLAKIR